MFSDVRNQMASKTASGPATEPEYPKIKGKLVPGIRLLPVKQGAKGKPKPPKPYGIVWTVKNKRSSMFFESVELLDKKVTELVSAKKAGTITLVPTSDELAEWRVFKAKIGSRSPLEIYAGWIAWRSHNGKDACDLTVSDAVTAFLKHEATRLEHKHIVQATFSQKRCKLRRFAESFASERLDGVRGDAIENWANSIPGVTSPEGINDHLRRVRELYIHYERIVTRSPMLDVEFSNEDGGEVVVMPAKDIAKLLAYTLKHRPYVLPRLCAEVFGGVRFSTAARLTRKSFKDESGILHIKPDEIKTKSWHSINGLPNAFWIWVRPWLHDERCWQISSVPEYMHIKSTLFTGANVTHPKNGLRKTFASMHVAHFVDPGKIARLLCHRDQERLWDTYLGHADEDEAALFFALTPANAGHVAAYERLPEIAQI